MNHNPSRRTARVPPSQHFEIRVIGHLTHRWSAWFDGMTLSPNDDGTTVIEGPVADQSALHGLLRTLGDLGLPLVSIKPTTQRRTRSTT